MERERRVVPVYVGHADWTRVADWTSKALGGTHGPAVLLVGLALCVLSSGAEVGGGEDLLRGHGGGRECVRWNLLGMHNACSSVVLVDQCDLVDGALGS